VVICGPSLWKAAGRGPQSIVRRTDSGGSGGVGGPACVFPKLPADTSWRHPVQPVFATENAGTVDAFFILSKRARRSRSWRALAKIASVTQHPPFGRPIRAALLLGFGLVVGVWLFVGYYFTRRIADLEQQASSINARYIRAQELLSTVRAQVLLGSVYVRDALLDSDPGAATIYRQRLEESSRVIDESLAQYVPVLDSTRERNEVAELRGQIADFRSTMLDVLSSDATTWRAAAGALLNTRIMPKREGVIGLSERAQALNRGAFVQQQSAMAAVYAATQRRMWASLGVALATSLGIAFVAALYAGRLEDRLRRQRAKDAQNATELQNLSARLLNAQEEERRSIARELHDEVGQALTAIKVELAVAHRAMDGEGAAVQALADARAIADGVLHTVRDLSHLLHPAMLDDLGLAAATAWYLKGFTKRHGLRTALLQDGMDERLAPEVESAVYRIVQEGLTNVAKHAMAGCCRVYLQRLTNTLLVTIEDDGIGFDPDERRSPEQPRGLGLVGIRERATQLGGTLRLESAPGRGTRLTVEVPAGRPGAVDHDLTDNNDDRTPVGAHAGVSPADR
jgi:signal transduction histidine kinase